MITSQAAKCQKNHNLFLILAHQITKPTATTTTTTINKYNGVK